MRSGKKRVYVSSSANSVNAPHPKRVKYNDDNIIDLGLEYPTLPHVLNSIKTEPTLELDPSFDLGQLAGSGSLPLIFDWNMLKTAMHSTKLRKEALRKQERSKYVKRDSMSTEQAADRRYSNTSCVDVYTFVFVSCRRRQNRESAKRTRDRVRKYISVLEMYYGHVQNVNSLLIKQLEVLAKFCCDKLPKEEMQSLKV